MSDVMPPTQRRVVKLVPEFAAKYKAAANELQKSTIYKEQQSALRAALKLQPGEKKTKWVGVIDQMGTTTSGDAYISVKISPEITLKTINVGFIDDRHTLIKNGSTDYKVLSQMKKGDVIQFGYEFGALGLSLTEAGKVENPEFETRFIEIKPAPGVTAGKLAP